MKVRALLKRLSKIDYCIVDNSNDEILEEGYVSKNMGYSGKSKFEDYKVTKIELNTEKNEDRIFIRILRWI